MNFNRWTIESLGSSMTVRFGNVTVKEKVVRSARRIIACEFPVLEDI